MDRDAATRISGYAFQVKGFDSFAVATDLNGNRAVSISPSGVTKRLIPTFAYFPRNPASLGAVLSYPEPLPLNLDAAEPGDEVAEITVPISPYAAGQVLSLQFNSVDGTTALSDKSGVLSETVSKGTLAVRYGCVRIASPADDQISLAPIGTPTTVGASVPVKVSIARAATVPTTIALTSLNTAVATVPFSVVIPPGLRTVSFDIEAIGTGLSTIVATSHFPLGVGTVTAGISVVPPMYPVIKLDPAAVQLNADNMLETLRISTPQPLSTAVALSSSDPAISVPSEVVIAAGQLSATFTLRRQSYGFATITATLPASLGGGKAEATVNAPDPARRPVFVFLTTSLNEVAAGSTISGTVTLSYPQTTPTEVALRSLDPAVATVPALVTVPAGATSSTFNIAAVAVGGSGIVATLPPALASATATAFIKVTAVGPPVAFDFAYLGANEGDFFPVQVWIARPQTNSTVIALASLNEAVASVPQSISIPAGATYGTFRVLAKAVGTTSIIATLPPAMGSRSALFTLRVYLRGTAPVPPILSAAPPPDAPMLPSLTPIEPAGVTGNVIPLTVSIYPAQSVATTVTLLATNPKVAIVPPSIALPAGATSAAIPLIAGITGTSGVIATLPASLGSGAAIASVTVSAQGAPVPPPSPLPMNVPAVSEVGLVGLFLGLMVVAATRLRV